MNVPRMSVEPGQDQSQQPQLAGETGSGRGKTVTSACERCRRRKIRCDGETPCATCRRFRISCVRIQKNDTHALEQRVRQLEAQIAEMSSGPSDQNALMTPQSWHSDIRLITDFGSPGAAVAMDQTFSSFLPTSLPTIEIPRIQVVDYADSSSPISPVSPVSLSRSPSLRSLAPVLPKSDNLDPGLRPASTGLPISPPVTACPSPNHSLNPYLSPRSVPIPSRSRSSSISSLSLDADWASAPGDILSGLTEADLNMSMFEMIPNSPTIEPSWTPTRFEAETLLDKFFDRTQGAGYSSVLDRSRLFELLNIVNHPSPPSAGVGRDLPCSTAMARFHVYMAMAIGLRMEREGRATTIHMLHNCYRLAFEETRAPSFWNQPYALEATMLIYLFAQVSGSDSLS
ncbi:hypothetical protein BDW59DRAFT_161139 [Aspergillus cavernicola]|uniref:Zn(2)-C6 fungal-type domain-containing protein n=1 Tax=Aspergillus cavernicola TaxID=176166 RepID=A0ABR4IEY4_9EURO